MQWLIPLGVGAPLLLMPITYMLVICNRLVVPHQHVPESSSGIDVELRRRCRLIPDLHATVKGYAAHERDVLEKIIALRNAAAAAAAALRGGRAMRRP